MGGGGMGEMARRESLNVACKCIRAKAATACSRACSRL